MPRGRTLEKKSQVGEMLGENVFAKVVTVRAKALRYVFPHGNRCEGSEPLAPGSIPSQLGLLVDHVSLNNRPATTEAVHRHVSNKGCHQAEQSNHPAMRSKTPGM
jgi:hypothetical protein